MKDRLHQTSSQRRTVTCRRKATTPPIDATLPLQIATERYRNITREQRLCPICNTGVIESELYFLLKCPVLKDKRKTYMQHDFFFTNPNIHKLFIMLSSKNEQTIKQISFNIVKALGTRTLHIYLWYNLVIRVSTWIKLCFRITLKFYLCIKCSFLPRKFYISFRYCLLLCVQFL